MKVVVRKFYKAYIDLFSNLFGYFSQIAKMPTREEEWFIRKTDKDNSIATSSRTTIDFLKLFEDNNQAIKGLAEYAAFKDSITKDMTDSAGNQLINMNDSWLIHNFCRYVCMRLYEESSSAFEFDQKAADSLYENMERYLLNDELIYNEKCILKNFKSDMDCIELDSNTTILRASNEEFLSLYRSREVTGMTPFDLFKDLYFIQTESKRKKTEPIAVGKNKLLFQNARISLLLFKDRLVALGPTVVMEAQGFDYLGGLYFSGAIDPSLPVAAKNYSLDATEHEDFRKFYKNVVKNLKKSFLRRAADRFVTAVYNHPYEERIIDFVIALECLYLPGIRSESSFRLCLRAAKLITNTTGEEIEDIYDDLKLAINLRNTLVHGEDPKKQLREIGRKHGNLHNFVRKIDGYMRESLSFFFQNPKKRTDRFFRRLELSLDT